MFEIRNLNIIQNKQMKVLVDNLSIQFHHGDKVALIGEEGTGKSSFLKILCGIDVPYVSHTYEFKTENKIVSYVPQHHFDHRSIRDYLLGDFEMMDYAYFYQLLDGMNIDEALIDNRPFNTLSGGEKVKISLIKALLRRPDIIFLDEPTNDLDLDALEYLETLLREIEIPVVFVSHDIRFIEKIANTIVHFEQIRRRTVSKVTEYRMDYREFLSYRQGNIDNQNRLAKEEREAIRIAEEKYERVHDRVHHELNKTKTDTVGKNLKDKMRSVKSVEKRIEKQKENLTDFVEFEEPINFILLDSPKMHSSKRLIDIKIDRLMIGNTHLSSDVSLQLIGPQRKVIVGDNGSGKSTLLKEIVKSCEQDQINFAYMPQTYEYIFDKDLTPIEILVDARDKDAVSKAMTYLGSLKFTEAEMRQSFKDLSGGQKAKLFFGKMAFEPLELLIMDEPTRNISPLSMETLIESLKGFNGAILAVSHDRHLIDSVFEEVYELKESGLIKLR